ncbi:MAG TPA: hypothetical protein VEL47_02845 [Myxococcota bacterium]|nr:hypothetical protein [Myxococcota bacterium]
MIHLYGQRAISASRDEQDDIILDSKSHHETWPCHWWPKQETRPGGDPINNLYAVGGPLDKLDQLTGQTARQYEYDHHRLPVDEGDKFAPKNHHNHNAVRAVCILPEPKHEVEMTAPDGSVVNFSKNDIQGLLVKIAFLLIEPTLSEERYFSPPGFSENRCPKRFHETLMQWAQDKKPFALSLHGWSFPVDTIEITESRIPPPGFDVSDLLPNAPVSYYHAKLSSTGVPTVKRVYEYYLQRARNGHVVNGDWTDTRYIDNDPYFCLWQVHGVSNIMDKAAWTLRAQPSNYEIDLCNPEIDPQLVYSIYKKSLE